MYYNNNQQGYIALIALLLVSATGLTIGIALSLGGIEEVQLSFGTSQAARAKSITNSCIEDGLERLRVNWSNYSGSLAIDQDSCIIDIVVNGSNATLAATGTVDIFKQKIKIQVDDTLEVTSWEE
ncbi:MAG: hypothetical protein CMI53_00870 [Parcubacteria group bacterium]|jgi:hypothetical protein|nr:hypothetical protein [Parcubacteria group bacterium]|tara:strand:- start:4152 stop:4526 length:375 start_codon:yes stop_codon:yes gene_type:complete